MVQLQEQANPPSPPAGWIRWRAAARVLVPFFSKLARFAEMIHPKMSVVVGKEPMRR